MRGGEVDNLCQGWLSENYGAEMNQEERLAFLSIMKQEVWKGL
jgi:hypothetical protein